MNYEELPLPLSYTKTVFYSFTENAVVGKRYYLNFDNDIRSNVTVGLQAIINTAEMADPIDLGFGLYYPTNSDQVKVIVITLVNIRDQVVCENMPLAALTLPGRNGNLKDIGRNIDPSKSWLSVLVDGIVDAQTTVPLHFYLKHPMKNGIYK